MALKGTETSGGPRNNFSSPCFLVFSFSPAASRHAPVKISRKETPQKGQLL
jgi:hypothetical protein